MSDSSILNQILASLADLQLSQHLLSQTVDKIRTESEYSTRKKLHINHSHDPVHSDSDHDIVVSPTFITGPDQTSLFVEKPPIQINQA
ncbi:hypothetical protein FBU30_008705 [Linnemannia zychae]|nr:hypothetical protein FBU30_008705 [Linnemannia zychae]